MVLLASLVVLGAAFAGCVGQGADLDPTKSSTGEGDTGDGQDVAVPPADGLKVLAPLAGTLSLSGPEWVAPGTKIPVSVTPPANAKGTVTYTWAVGPLPGTTEVTEAGLNTKDILAGGSATLKFDKSGVYGIHCHPHPFMLSNVTVIEGHSGPAEATVYITDGSTTGEFRFVPEHVVIPVGGKVVYKNVGTQMHTATQAGQEPALVKDGLTGASGEIVASGEGWQRVVVVIQDSEGRIGRAEQRVYVASLPEDLTKEISGDFNLGIPAQAPQDVTETKTESFKLDRPGVITINFTAQDPAAANGAPENTALVEVHLKEQGATQDTLTADPASEGSLTGRVAAKTYELSLIPRQGAAIHYTATITVVYDLVPPEPAAAGAPPADGHGGHAH